MQVKVVNLKLSETCVDCPRDVVDSLVYFVGDEKLFARHTSFLDRDANLFLCSVHFCTIKMVEAFLDGCFGHIYKLLVDLSVADFLEPGCSSAKSELDSSDISLGHNSWSPANSPVVSYCHHEGSVVECSCLGLSNGNRVYVMC